MKIASRYITLPINNSAPNTTVTFTEEGLPIYVLDAKISDSPRYTAFVDISRFIGRELEISLPAGLFGFADGLPDALDVTDGSNELRPRVHFSPRQGWTNDPNGLVFYNGEYHLFFQHNPAGNQWGNMHWGHAVSPDLMHWKELPVALYPDMSDGRRTNTIYSGSAIIDKRNAAGFGENALLLFYTSAGEPFEQHLAYSKDGRTFVKYEGNPIVGHIAGANRDPKVIWCDELCCFVMALYLDGNTYALLRSDNLLSWTELQRFELPNDSECPDFYPLNVCGGEKNGERRWVFTGASDRYLVGSFEGGLFTPCQTVRSLHETPNVLYAAQTYSDTPDGRRIRFSWDTSNLAASRNMRWGCQMSVPAEMKLCYDGDGYSLCVYPIEQLLSLRKSGESAAFDIEAEIEAADNAELNVYGVKLPIPSNYCGKRINVRIISDRTGAECYFGRGEMYTARGGISDFTQPPLTAENAVVHNLRIAGLSSCL